MDTQLFDRLRLPMPIRWHQKRSLPGGGDYIYLPWYRYSEWLDQHAYGQWQTVYTPAVVAGDWLSINCTLTICGCSRGGIGTCKAVPEKNSDGKDKIIGDPHKNAHRSAFVDACYQFGISKHLDYQDDVFVWVLGVHKNGKKATNADRLSAARILMGIDPAVIKNLLKEAFDKSANQLNAEEIQQVLEILEIEQTSCKENSS